MDTNPGVSYYRESVRINWGLEKLQKLISIGWD